MLRRNGPVIKPWSQSPIGSRRLPPATAWELEPHGSLFSGLRTARMRHECEERSA